MVPYTCIQPIILRHLFYAKSFISCQTDFICFSLVLERINSKSRRHKPHNLSNLSFFGPTCRLSVSILGLRLYNSVSLSAISSLLQHYQYTSSTESPEDSDWAALILQRGLQRCAQQHNRYYTGPGAFVPCLKQFRQELTST